MIVAALAAVTVLQAVQAPPTTTLGPKKRVVVSGFDLKIKSMDVDADAPSGATISATLDITDDESFGSGMVDMLNTALVSTKRFVVLERQDLDDVTKEQGVAVSEQTRLDATRLLGAQVLVRGALTEMGLKKRGWGNSGGVIQLGQLRLTATAAIDLKLIDAATGEILDSIRSEGSVLSTFTSATVPKFKIGYEAFEAGSLSKAVRAAIDKGVLQLVSRTERLPWEAKVASVGGSDESPLLYLTFGDDAGVPQDTILEVFRPGAAVIDPDSQIVLGREDDVVLGRCRVRNSTSKLTVAVLIEGEGVRAGDGVRVVRS